MKFMLLCYHEEAALDRAGEAEMRRAMDEAVALVRELDASGKYILSSPLHPVATATAVQVRNGKRIVTDGPFAETREVLGGFYLIDAKDRDEAIAIAARAPGARMGAMEVRPVLEMSGLPRAE